jgi:hypothetical protein
MRYVKLLVLFTCITLSCFVQAADDDSKFLSTTSDTYILGTNGVSVLSYSLVLTQTKNVFLAASGRYFPYMSSGTSVVLIRVDGNDWYSSHAVISWVNSDNAVQHSFDCIALVTLAPGTHTIELIGNNHSSTPSAGFVVGANSGLSIMTNPAPNIMCTTLDEDSPIIDHNTVGIGGDGELPATTLLTHNIITPTATNVVSMVSGRSYCAGTQGDALWGIYLNDQCPSGATSCWTVNDMFTGAEMHAPMYCYSMHTLTGNNTLDFKATELSWGVDQGADLVQYRVGRDVRFLSMWGMGISGSADIHTRECSRVDWHCIGTSINMAGCNVTGTNTLLAETTINIPNGHNGVVFFKTATRLQPDSQDPGGHAALWLNIDGVDVGATGVQQFNYPNCESSRTIVASYLAAGNNKLSPGQHVVRVYARASGTFRHLAATNDLPLIYFD